MLLFSSQWQQTSKHLKVHKCMHAKHLSKFFITFVVAFCLALILCLSAISFSIFLLLSIEQEAFFSEGLFLQFFSKFQLYCFSFSLRPFPLTLFSYICDCFMPIWMLFFILFCSPVLLQMFFFYIVCLLAEIIL